MVLFLMLGFFLFIFFPIGLGILSIILKRIDLLLIMIGENNHFNIREGSNWIGSCGSTRGFVDFDGLNYCVRAAWIIICQSYRRRGILTISEIISTFAPPKENDTEKYIDFICRKMGCFPFDILCSKLQYCQLLSFMSEYEVGKRDMLSVDTILSVVDEFKLQIYDK